MVTSFYYTPEGTLKQNLGEEELRAVVRAGSGQLWVDLNQPTADEVFLLDETFGFHPLAIEDCQAVSQFPKLDEFRTHVFLVFLAPNPDLKPGSDGGKDGPDPSAFLELDLFLGKNYVVTCHLQQLGFLEPQRERARQEPARFFGRGPALLAHALIDAAVDQFFAVVTRLQEEAESIEEELQQPASRDVLARVSSLRHRVLTLRRRMSGHREIIQSLIRSGHPAVAPESLPYFRDILDHLGRIERDLDFCRETLDSSMDVCLALTDVRTNEVIRVLTVLFTLTLPAALMTSWYGMNFKYLPMMEHEYGVYIFTGLMALLAVGLLLWFRIKKWL